jgi:hypothetical protein
LAEWLHEEGIGESRAILVEEGEILEAAIELPGTARVGAVETGRLTEIHSSGLRGIVSVEKGPVLVEPLPPALTQGLEVRVEIVREAIAEPGKPKLARGRITDEAERPAPSLRERAAGVVLLRPTDPDRFEEAGWSELIEEARTGEILFPGGSLRMSLTPAMALFDVDGGLPPAELAIAGATAAARAVRRLGIGGSIGVDLPTVPSKAARQRAAEALDAILPQPFERTAVNGFGFLQVVRRRERESIPELLRSDPAGAAARALLRRAERTPGAGTRLIVAAPPVVARIEAQPEWLDALARRTGAAPRLRADGSLTIWAGHVQSAHS